MPCQKQGLPADRVLYMCITPYKAGNRRSAAKKSCASAGQSRCGSLTSRRSAGLVYHKACVAAGPVGCMQLQSGICVGQARWFFSCDDQQCVSPGLLSGARDRSSPAPRSSSTVSYRAAASVSSNKSRCRAAGATVARLPDPERPAKTSKPPGTKCAMASESVAVPDITDPRSKAGVSPSWMSTLARPRSASNSSTRRPFRASACASVMANQVLPTPPLPDPTATQRPIRPGTAGDADRLWTVD